MRKVVLATSIRKKWATVTARDRNGGEVDVDGTSNPEICGATSNGDPAKSKREKQNLRKSRQRQWDNAAVEAAADAAERQTRRTALQRYRRDRRRVEVTLNR